MRLPRPSAAYRYSAAVLLAVLAQIVRLPLEPPTLIHYISYVPFMILSAALGGLGPGLLTSALCVLEAAYFATEPVGSFAVRDAAGWEGLAALLLTGLFAAILFERARRAERADAVAHRLAAGLAREREERERMLEFIIQNSLACIALLRDPDFTFESVNPAYQALLPDEPMVGRTVAEVWPEAAALVLPLLRVVRDAQTVYSATEVLIPRRRHHDGPTEERYFDFSYVPLTGPDGGPRVLVVAVEVTRHKRAEAELRAVNQDLATIYDSAPVGLLVVDEDLRVRKVNDLASQYTAEPAQGPFGLRRGDAFDCLNALADPRGCGAGPACGECTARTAVLESLRSGSRHDGLEAWFPASSDNRERQCLLLSTAPMQINGVRKVLVCTHDITRRKQAEEILHETVRQLETALTQKTVLLKEVHHRVKNNLSVISSLLAMKADAAGAAESRQVLEESRRRVHSIALIHEHLYSAENLDRVNFAEYARQLVLQLQGALVDRPGRIAVCLDVAPIEMGVHRAVPCALILNELVSNAFKHAFPAPRTGEIAISLREPAPNFLELCIEDDGIGSPLDQAPHNPKSLGLKIVRILADQLDGSFEQLPSAERGTRFVVRFPAGSARSVA